MKLLFQYFKSSFFVKRNLLSTLIANFVYLSADIILPWAKEYTHTNARAN
jgi:hypothetical protein